MTANLAVQMQAPSGGEKVRTLGRYSLIAQIGRGGMGVIYLALVRGPAGFNKLFVVKELKPELAAEAEVVRLFLEEARLSARMNHPNVVQTIEVGTQDGRHFIAMEYLEGQSLVEIRERCTEHGTKLPDHFAISILVGALEGLSYAHTLTDFDGSAQGVIHRDVSPHNIFVTFDGTVKVLDFGIAKATNSQQHTETGVLKGKVAYMSPEQATAQAIDCRIDIFALGVVLWEAIAGRRMWGDAVADMTILHALWNRDIPDIAQVRPDVPPQLAGIIRKATAANRDDRYQTAADLRKALEDYLATLPVGAFGPRDIGRFVRELFEHDRAEIKARIDTQLKLLASASQDASDIGMARVYAGATPLGTSVVQPLRVPAGPDPAENTAPRLVAEAPVVATKSRGTLLVAALAGGVVALGAGWLALHRPQPAAQADPVVASAAASPAPVKPAPSVHVTVSVSPPSAHLVVDGQPVAGNPFAGTFPVDTAKHTVSADAPGFEPSSVDVLFDEDRTVNLALHPVAPQPAAAPSRSPLRATPTPGGSPARPTRKKDDLEPF